MHPPLLKKKLESEQNLSDVQGNPHASSRHSLSAQFEKRTNLGNAPIIEMYARESFVLLNHGMSMYANLRSDATKFVSLNASSTG